VKSVLTEAEKTEILSSLTEQQRLFISEYVKRGKKTVFANQLALDKGIVLPNTATNEEIEMLLEGWILEDYIDSGFVNPKTPCECGRPLRYQYIVKHLSTSEIRRFGIDHFKEHTGLSSEIVKSVIKDFAKVDYELEEIIQKISSGWSLEYLRVEIPDEFEIPNDIRGHITNNIPLLNRQINRLEKMVLEYKEKNEFEERYTLVYEEKQQLEKSQLPKFKLESKGSEFNKDYKENQIYFDFEHSVTTNLIINNNISKKSLDLALSQQIRKLVLEYLEITHSTRIICELLIKNKFVSEERYITKKPKIYMQVAKYLDDLVNEEIVELIGTVDYEDRLYQLVKK